MITSRQIVSAIKKSQHIAIFAHEHPDPDAYGSIFAMREFCRNLGKNADIFAIKDKVGYLDNIFPLSEIRTDFKAEEFDLVLILDVSQINRVALPFRDELGKCKKIIIIDHHQIVESNPVSSDLFYIKSNYAAVCEILAEIAVKERLKITPTIATYLYTGLMGDTDRFLHNNLSRHVFETAILLFDKGAEIQKVYDYLYRYTTRQQIEINKFLLNNLHYKCDKRAVYVIVTLQDLKELGADQEDVKAFSNELIRIKGVDVSFICFEYAENLYKVSMRSKSGVNTLVVSTKNGGGGHICASAFQIETSKTALKDKIDAWAKEILND